METKTETTEERISRFSLMIDCENAAFGDDEASTAQEIATILGNLAGKFMRGADGPEVRDSGKLQDANGNSVGKWSFVDGALVPERRAQDAASIPQPRSDP